MKPEIKKPWVEALRSGKYKQTKEKLRNEDGFCCLGVLCDIIDPNGWTKSENGQFNGHIHGNSNDNLNIFTLWDIDLYNTHEHDLVKMNDEGKTFEEIATWIEATL